MPRGGARVGAGRPKSANPRIGDKKRGRPKLSDYDQIWGTDDDVLNALCLSGRFDNEERENIKLRIFRNHPRMNSEENLSQGVKLSLLNRQLLNSKSVDLQINKKGNKLGIIPLDRLKRRNENEVNDFAISMDRLRKRVLVALRPENISRLKLNLAAHIFVQSFTSALNEIREKNKHSAQTAIETEISFWNEMNKEIPQNQVFCFLFDRLLELGSRNEIERADALLENVIARNFHASLWKMIKEKKSMEAMALRQIPLDQVVETHVEMIREDFRNFIHPMRAKIKQARAQLPLKNRKFSPL